MVKLEEVLDEEFAREQAGQADEDDWDTDSGSDAESDVSDETADESLYDRLVALQDIVPPAYRRNIRSTLSTGSSWVKSGVKFGGQAIWVVSTTVLLLGVPWALAYSDEQQMIEMEREMRAQQSANELTNPGSTAAEPQAGPTV